MNWNKISVVVVILSALGLGCGSLQALAAASDPIVLQEGRAVKTIKPQFSWHYDESGKASIADILAKGEDAFKAYALNPIPFTFSLKPFWLRFSLHNGSPVARWYLVAKTAIMENVEVYELGSDTTWQRQLPLPKTRTATTPITLAPGETKHYLVRFQTYDPPSDFFSIMDDATLRQDNVVALPFYGMMLGIILAIILYNAFIYVSLRRRIYLYYLFFAIANGFIAAYSINIPIGLSQVMSAVEWGHALRFLAPFTALLFAKVLLETKKNSRRIDLAMNALLLAYAGLVVYDLLTGDSSPLNLLCDIFIVAAIVLSIAAGVISWQKGNASAKYFLTAMGVFFFSIIVVMAHPMMGLPTNLYTTSAHLIGQAAEMVLMSLALASLIKTLEEEKVRAETSALIKSKLLRVMSHDIVNPLTLIKGFSQMMLRKPSESEYVEKIIRSASIIENIVHFVVKYESRRGARSFQLTPVAIRDVFDELSFLFQQPLAEKGIEATFEVQPNNLAVLAERVSLSNEILANLISNAIKFSFVGSTIDIKAVAQGERVAITISDHGVGIPKDTLSNLFDSVQNYSRRGTNGELGSGFGMPIVWSFVKELGGEIKVDSVSFDQNSQNSGTTVTIILKRATSA